MINFRGTSRGPNRGSWRHARHIVARSFGHSRTWRNMNGYSSHTYCDINQLHSRGATDFQCKRPVVLAPPRAAARATLTWEPTPGRGADRSVMPRRVARVVLSRASCSSGPSFACQVVACQSSEANHNCLPALVARGSPSDDRAVMLAPSSRRFAARRTSIR